MRILEKLFYCSKPIYILVYIGDNVASVRKNEISVCARLNTFYRMEEAITFAQKLLAERVYLLVAW